MDLEQRLIFFDICRGINSTNNLHHSCSVQWVQFQYCKSIWSQTKENVLPLRIQLADGSPEQLPIQREVRFGPHHPRGLVDGGVGTTVDVAVSFQSVLCRPHHVGGFHRGPGVYKTSGQVHFIKNLEENPTLY